MTFAKIWEGSITRKTFNYDYQKTLYQKYSTGRGRIHFYDVGHPHLGLFPQ